MSSILEEVLAGLPNSDEVVKIKNVHETQDIIDQLKQSGPGSLQVIADFDHTLTRYRHKGARCPTCYEIFSNNPLLPLEATERLGKLYAKNAHILVNCKLTMEEKIPLLEEWYRDGHDILTSYKISKSIVKEMAIKSPLRLRKNTSGLIDLLNESDIPLLIFSGGLGNFIETILQNCNIHCSPNLKIIANYMEFDENEELVSFTDPPIHSYNKGLSTGPETSEYFLELADRTNAILLGDSLGDVSMASGVLHSESILKIGFLNSKIDECLEDYLANFDIVLVDDQSMDFVNALLKNLFKKT